MDIFKKVDIHMMSEHTLCGNKQVYRIFKVM